MTVEDYIKKVPEKDKEAFNVLRSKILKSIPKGIVEVFNNGLISYQLPLEKYPKTYNKQPLMYLALASRKEGITLTLTAIYNDKEVKEKFIKNASKVDSKLDLKRSCIKFKKNMTIPVDEISKALKEISLKKFIANYEALMMK